MMLIFLPLFAFFSTSFFRPLFFQLFFIIFYKPLRFIFRKERGLFHIRYPQYLFSALFLHLLIKFIFFIFVIELDFEYNLLLLMLCIITSSIIDIYYYITLIVFYMCKICYYRYISTQLAGMDNSWLYPESVHAQFSFHKYNYQGDLYYFFRPFLIFFILIRYLIIREPLFFLAINSTIIINYLIENNLFLMYLYLITDTI